MATIKEVQNYCNARHDELVDIITNSETPWGFLCAAAFIDFLAKLNEGRDNKRKGYKNFIIQRFPKKYTAFRYKSGDKDLPEQLYKVFRCGILHSFSLLPDENNRGSYKKKTIIISHNEPLYKHLDNYTEKKYDAAILIAKDFADDLKTSMSNMFNDKKVHPKILSHYNRCSPICEII